MYEQHFGLEKRPFSVKATGTEVFVGPQTAKTMAGFRKALAAQDSVVTVSGMAGTGKTTLVERSLDATGSKYKTIRVGRIQMNASDVLESLLIVLGVTDRPTGTIQRFTALRKKLKDLQEADTRVFILVEDALRAGTETLAELEALTDGDAGESDGASIVLMGDERLFEFMKDPTLAQLQQRVRQRHRIQPLCEAELRGYLKHCLRMAGGDFEQIFDARSAELVHELSEGIPRVANNLLDAVLVAAASQGTSKISAKVIATVASDEFGLSAEDFDFTIPSETESRDAEPAPAADAASKSEPSAPAEASAPAAAAEEPIPVPGAVPESAPAQDVRPDEASPAVVAEEPLPGPDAVAEPAPAEEPGEASEPVIVFADAQDEPSEDLMDIPHLIQDTLPDLAILSKRYATLAESYEGEAQEATTEPTAESPCEEMPELAPEPTAELADEEIPELTPEPTAELADEEIPDLTAEPQTTAATDDAKEPELPIVEAPADEPANDADPNWKLTAEPEFEMVTNVEPALDVAPTTETDAGSGDIPELRAEPDPEPGTEDIPELRNEQEAVVEPTPLATPEPVNVEVPEPADDVALEAENLAELEPEQPATNADTSETQPESAPEEIPEWERDPTLAQLKPDLDALEQAMAFTHGEEPSINGQNSAIEPEKLAESVADVEEIPEIILDKSIETGVGELEFEEPSDIQPPGPAKTSDPQLDRIAADIANAKSLEDIDDIMAETLFGSGISMIAEQVTANPPTANSANDELELAHEPPAAPSPAPELKAPPVAENRAAPNRSDISEEISIETSTAPAVNSGLDLSASQRLKTVRALNADLHPSLREPGNDGPADSGSAFAAPEPIEDQINTSITQTLKTLKLPPEVSDDEPDDEPKKGFLSRFRRS